MGSQNKTGRPPPNHGTIIECTGSYETLKQLVGVDVVLTCADCWLRHCVCCCWCCGCVLVVIVLLLLLLLSLLLLLLLLL